MHKLTLRNHRPCGHSPIATNYLIFTFYGQENICHMFAYNVYSFIKLRFVTGPRLKIIKGPFPIGNMRISLQKAGLCIKESCSVFKMTFPLCGGALFCSLQNQRQKAEVNKCFCIVMITRMKKRLFSN